MLITPISLVSAEASQAIVGESPYRPGSRGIPNDISAIGFPADQTYPNPYAAYAGYPSYYAGKSWNCLSVCSQLGPYRSSVRPSVTMIFVRDYINSHGL